MRKVSNSPRDDQLHGRSRPGYQISVKKCDSGAAFFAWGRASQTSQTMIRYLIARPSYNGFGCLIDMKLGKGQQKIMILLDIIFSGVKS